MLLKDTKILDAVYSKKRHGYNIMCLREATTTARGVQEGED